jgi:pyruvate/2-oxoglutarate dehydrogenase complex dihydrolipoamide acyltransferase (E2) component
MTDETSQAPKAPKKKADRDTEAYDAARAEAIKLALAEGVAVDADWPIERIESATLKAMQAKEDEAKRAAAEAAKPAPVAKPAPAEDPDTRAEVMKTAHEAGMDLEDLKGRPLDVVLSMIGKHMTEQTIRKAQRVPENVGRVEVRVLKKGDNKISKGIHVPGVGDLCYKTGDHLSVSRESAIQLEERGFVEIVG